MGYSCLRSPLSQRQQQEKKRRQQQQVVKSGQEEQSVSKIGYRKIYGFPIGLNEVLRWYKLIQPVARKGEQIPDDDQVQENPEFAPAMVSLVFMVETVKQTGHSGCKQEVADLMGYQALYATMCLYRHYGTGDQQQ